MTWKDIPIKKGSVNARKLVPRFLLESVTRAGNHILPMISRIRQYRRLSIAHAIAAPLREDH